MVIQQLFEALAAVVPAQQVVDLADEAPLDGNQLADGLKNFMAPIAAVLIGVVGLKFLFGENRSLAGFIGFMVLAVVVFALIQFGMPILDALSGTVQSWTS